MESEAQEKTQEAPVDLESELGRLALAIFGARTGRVDTRAAFPKWFQKLKTVERFPGAAKALGVDFDNPAWLKRIEMLIAAEQLAFEIEQEFMHRMQQEKQQRRPILVPGGAKLQ